MVLRHQRTLPSKFDVKLIAFEPILIAIGVVWAVLLYPIEVINF